MLLLLQSTRESHAPHTLDKARFTLYTQCMHDLLPFLFVMILRTAPFAEAAAVSDDAVVTDQAQLKGE